MAKANAAMSTHLTEAHRKSPRPPAGGQTVTEVVVYSPSYSCCDQRPSAVE